MIINALGSSSTRDKSHNSGLDAMDRSAAGLREKENFADIAEKDNSGSVHNSPNWFHVMESSFHVCK